MTDKFHESNSDVKTKTEGRVLRDLSELTQAKVFGSSRETDTGKCREWCRAHLKVGDMVNMEMVRNALGISNSSLVAAFMSNELARGNLRREGNLKPAVYTVVHSDFAYRRRTHVPKYTKSAVKLEDAKRWLTAFLGNGPKLTSEVLRLGNLAGYHHKMLRRAMIAIYGVSVRGENKKYRWRLPDEVHANNGRGESVVDAPVAMSPAPTETEVAAEKTLHEQCFELAVKLEEFAKSQSDAPSPRQLIDYTVEELMNELKRRFEERV